MSRKRLTTATLQDRQRHASSEQAADLAFKLLGPSASDKELITAGATLHRNLGPQKVASMHSLASRIAQETGEDFPGPSENEGPPQPDPADSQEYVTEHVAAPDHVVLDTVVNKTSPSVDPTASRRAAEEDDSEEVVAGLQDDDDSEEVVAGRQAADDDDDEMPDMEDPMDMEGDTDDYVEDEADEAEESMDMGDMEDEDMEDPGEDYEEGSEDEPGLDDFMDDSDTDYEGGGSTSNDQGGSEEYYDSYPEDDREFSVGDLQALQDLGVEEIPGVMASPKGPKGRKGRKGRRAAGKKQQFRPSRTRTASRGNSDGDEFEGVFGTPDLGDMFVH